MATITAMDAVNHDLYAKKNVVGYDASFTNITQNFSPGQLIGNIYSWVTGKDGAVYWMFYPTQDDYNNFTNAFYVRHDASALSLPDLPDILQQIDERAQVNAQIELQKQIDAAGGAIPYYFKKYGNLVLWGAGIAYVGIPLLKSISEKKSVGAANKKAAGGLILLLLAGGVLMAAKKPKTRSGSLIVDPLSPGNFVQDNGDTYVEPIIVEPTAPVLMPTLPQHIDVTSAPVKPL